MRGHCLLSLARWGRLLAVLLGGCRVDEHQQHQQCRQQQGLAWRPWRNTMAAAVAVAHRGLIEACYRTRSCVRIRVGECVWMRHTDECCSGRCTVEARRLGIDGGARARVRVCLRARVQRLDRSHHAECHDRRGLDRGASFLTTCTCSSVDNHRAASYRMGLAAITQVDTCAAAVLLHVCCLALAHSRAHSLTF